MNTLQIVNAGIHKLYKPQMMGKYSGTPSRPNPQQTAQNQGSPDSSKRSKDLSESELQEIRKKSQSINVLSDMALSGARLSERTRYKNKQIEKIKERAENLSKVNLNELANQNEALSGPRLSQFIKNVEASLKELENINDPSLKYLKANLDALMDSAKSFPQYLHYIEEKKFSPGHKK